MFTLRGVEYRVTDSEGRELSPGDIVTDFRGDQAIIRRLTRAPEPGRSGLVLVDGNRELYHQVFGLTIERAS